MTQQEFNNIYYSFSNDKKGIKPWDRITTTGHELKSFLEFAFKRAHSIASNDQMRIDFH